MYVYLYTSYMYNSDCDKLFWSITRTRIHVTKLCWCLLCHIMPRAQSGPFTPSERGNDSENILWCLSFIYVRNAVTARLCFHRRLSFCPQGWGVCGRQPALRQTPPPGRHPLPSACWYTHPLPSACWDNPPPRPAATAADDTHPTGMHSCFLTHFACHLIFFTFGPICAWCEYVLIVQANFNEFIVVPTHTLLTRSLQLLCVC